MKNLDKVPTPISTQILDSKIRKTMHTDTLNNWLVSWFTKQANWNKGWEINSNRERHDQINSSKLDLYLVSNNPRVLIKNFPRTFCIANTWNQRFKFLNTRVSLLKMRFFATFRNFFCYFLPGKVRFFAIFFAFFFLKKGLFLSAKSG